MSKTTCRHCGCSEVEKDQARGDTVCTNCGVVLEENVIVSEVQFQETGAGGHSVIGQYVSSDMPNKINIGGITGGDSRQSREVTLQIGRRRIQEVASQLRLNQHCVDTAFNFYKMSLARGLTRGRRWTHTVAACLYITCRLEGTAHFLLDFSDVLQVNVFELGKVFSFLSRMLYITLPLTDPCIYVMRFAHALDFGEKEHDVAMVALRLVQRMKRDWMAIGRRPTGLCGAALLLAARFHNFNRTISDIIRVVHLSESVIRRRLDEFAATPTASLSLDDFQTVDLEEECDPPAFSQSRKKAKKPTAVESEKLDEMEGDLLRAEKEIERILDKKRKRNYPQMSYGPTKPDPDRSASSSFTLTNVNLAHAGDGEAVDPELAMSQEFLNTETLREIMNDSETPETNVNRGDSETPASRFSGFRPTLESLGISNEHQNYAESAPNNGKTDSQNDELDLSGIDDEEIEGYLLVENEITIKRKLWDIDSEPFVIEQEEKRLKREEEAKMLESQGLAKKRKTKPRKKIQQQAATAGEAIEKIVQEKKLSSKINYDVLKALGEPDFKSQWTVNNNFSTDSDNIR